MIQKKNKIDFYKDYRFFNNFKKRKNQNFLIFYQKLELKNPQIGIIIPKKNIKKKVQRNLVKRRLLAIFKKNINLCQNLKIILIVFPSSLETNFQNLELNFLKEIKLINR